MAICMRICKQRWVATTLLAAAIAAGASGRARAEDLEQPRHRQGYWVALGLYGLGQYNTEEGESLGVWPGMGYGLRFGELLTRRFGMGLNIDFGGSSGKGQTASLFGLGLEAQYEVANNLAVRAGFGLAAVGLMEDKKKNPDAVLRGSYGGAYSLGLSYDWFPWKRRLTGGFAVTPSIQVRFIPGDTITTVVGLAGIEIAWWTGRPMNQLDLPDAEAYKKRKE